MTHHQTLFFTFKKRRPPQSPPDEQPSSIHQHAGFCSSVSHSATRKRSYRQVRALTAWEARLRNVEAYLERQIQDVERREETLAKGESPSRDESRHSMTGVTFSVVKTHDSVGCSKRSLKGHSERCWIGLRSA